MKILSGKAIAAQILEKQKENVKQLMKKNIVPGLAVVLVGDDPASKIYVSAKEKMCKELGIHSVKIVLDANISQSRLDEVVDELNRDQNIHGILCQSPLPSHLDEKKTILAIDPAKDVDCFHPLNLGFLAMGEPRFMPCTPYGVIQILKFSEIPVSGKNIVVLGRSNIVGRPLSILLSLKGYDATVTVCHSRTRDLEKICSLADILVVAIGKPEFVKENFIKENAVVIDVGINRVKADNEKGYRIAGDADFEACEKKASAATPVPGGVGPLTIQMLMLNTINSARLKNGLDKFEL